MIAQLSADADTPIGSRSYRRWSGDLELRNSLQQTSPTAITLRACDHLKINTRLPSRMESKTNRKATKTRQYEAEYQTQTMNHGLSDSQKREEESLHRSEGNAKAMTTERSVSRYMGVDVKEETWI
jgi:hypothetical protein